MIDTHAHLDACAEPADVLVERAREAGVTRIVSVGTQERSWRETIAIAERHEGVVVALGIHPHEAGDGDVAALREALDASEGRRSGGDGAGLLPRLRAARRATPRSSTRSSSSPRSLASP